MKVYGFRLGEQQREISAPAFVEVLAETRCLLGLVSRKLHQAEEKTRVDAGTDLVGEGLVSRLIIRITRVTICVIGG